VTIRALLSKADGTDVEVDLEDWDPRKASDDELLWVDIDRPSRDELAKLVRAFGLEPDVANALTSTPDVPDAIVHKRVTEVVILALAKELEDEPVPVRTLIGEGWVVTHRDADVPFVDDHRQRISDQREVGRLTPLEFLAALLDRHVETFFLAAEALEAEVDELDDAALQSEDDLLGRLVAMRRRIAHVRSVLTPHRELAAELTRPDFLASADERAERALAEVAQRLDRAGDAIARAREMLIGTFDVHMTRMAQRTNDTMRILTLASVILLPSVVLAGVMGMNFKVPIFDQASLFYAVVGLMVLLAVATLVVARWRHWI
jgi:Mg2+ and Co2+ transporter CorA